MAFDDKFIIFADKNALPIPLPDGGQNAGASYILTNTGTSQLRLGGPLVSGGPTAKGWPWPAGITLTFNVNISDTAYVAAEDPTTARVDYVVQDT